MSTDTNLVLLPGGTFAFIDRQRVCCRWCVFAKVLAAVGHSLHVASIAPRPFKEPTQQAHRTQRQTIVVGAVNVSSPTPEDDGGGAFSITFAHSDVSSVSHGDVNITDLSANVVASALFPNPKHIRLVALAAMPGPETNATRLFAASSSASCLLQSHDLGTTWRELGAEVGFSFHNLAQLQERERTRWRSAQYIYAATPVHVPGLVYIAGFNGVWKSTNCGESWVHLDLLLSVITDLQVETASASGHAITVCTYASDCYRGVFAAPPTSTSNSVSNSTPTPAALAPMVLPDAVILQAATAADVHGFKHQNLQGWHDYNIIGMPPDYTTHATKRILRGRLSTVFRSEDAGKSWTKAATILPAITNMSTVTDPAQPCGTGAYQGGTCIKRLHFSPAFALDQTVFATGYNIGVQVSTNGGTDFKVRLALGRVTVASPFS